VAPLLERSCQTDLSLVLLVVDVDGIDFALRTFGPFDRDALIRDIGQHLQEATSGNATPYHIMQGRFALVMTDVSYRRATQEARAVVETLNESFEVCGSPYRLDAHVGIGHYPNHATTVNELVRTAVFATHQARVNRSGYAIFDQEWDRREQERFGLMVDLGQALDTRDQLQLAFQPKLDLRSGHCKGVEALCRWNHPRKGFIPPGHFLPYVEQSNLIMPLTEAVMAEGLAKLAGWHDRGFEGDLAINLSPVLFRDPDLKERLREHFRFSNLDPAKVQFEVTESGIMEEPNQSIHTLTQIRTWGCQVAVDDFGTGHSSLAYLADLPVDSLKIDKHFVQGLAQPWGEAIVGASVTLAQKLGLGTIAEGIEEKEQLQKCRELGCDQAQGFYTGRPMFARDFEQWLGLD
jgi:EAL domain-containing protein (putative c-di-GMP-specific phosphodiesterase class I)